MPNRTFHSNIVPVCSVTIFFVTVTLLLQGDDMLHVRFLPSPELNPCKLQSLCLVPTCTANLLSVA